MSYNVVNPDASAIPAEVPALRVAVNSMCEALGIDWSRVEPEVILRLNSETFTDRDIAYLAVVVGVRPSDFAASLRPDTTH